ncbi:MAG: transcriptional repressor [Candidatus Omnitrophota bacterium]|nr:transcriptional repressor [Candidatus Omnitrophota bacterium]
MLQRCGDKASRNRTLVLDVLTKSSGALSPVDILSLLRREHSFDKVTLYRTLDYLAKKEILRRIPTLRGAVLYEVACEKHNPRHVHFYCRDCGRMKCLLDHEINAVLGRIQKKYLKAGEEAELKVEGLCEKCERQHQRRKG